MRTCSSHVPHHPDPQRSRRGPPEAPHPRRPRGGDALRAPRARGAPPRGAADPGGDAGTPALPPALPAPGVPCGRGPRGTGRPVIVLDASVVLELVLATGAAPRIAGQVLDPSESLHAPHLLDVEVAQAVRR